MTAKLLCDTNLGELAMICCSKFNSSSARTDEKIVRILFSVLRMFDMPFLYALNKIYCNQEECNMKRSINVNLLSFLRKMFRMQVRLIIFVMRII